MSRVQIDPNVRLEKREPTLQEVLEDPHIERHRKNKVQIDVLQRSRQLSVYDRRSKIDEIHTDININLNKHFTDEESELGKRNRTHDEHDIFETYPSYQKFRVPFNILSRERYARSKLIYGKQFLREINNLIDFQASALEASCLVRLTSYTTLWPPLHNYEELEYTSNMFQLTPKEKRRLDYIMTHEFY